MNASLNADRAGAPPSTLAQPLVVVRAEACGSSGLNARALGAAMWSHATHFELIDGTPLGIEDVLRVAMCPLFDSATPWTTRLEGLLDCALQGEGQSAWEGATLRHCIRPMDAQLAIATTPQAPRAALNSAAPTAHHHGANSFVEALQHIGRQPAAAPGRTFPTATLLAVDSLMHAPQLQRLHANNLLSTEELAQGLIPSEACAWLALVPQSAADFCGQRAVVRGASFVPLGPSPGQALMAALLGAVGDDPPAMHTVLWDIGPHAALLPAIAEAISGLGPLVQTAQFVRPLQYIGGTGAAFGAVATVLAIEGCRAGTTAGGRTLICSLTPEGAWAVYIEAPWHPPIMLADAPRVEP